MATLRIVSLNTWKGEGDYPRRLALMEEELHALSPDVILLQEDLCAPDLKLHTAGHLARSFDHRAVLPLRPKVRRVSGASASSTSGMAVLSRLPILAQRRIDLPSDERDGERACLAVEVRTSLGPLQIANLHLTHLQGEDDLRCRQLAAVLKGLDLGRCAATLLGGDFNAPASAFEQVGQRIADVRVMLDIPARPTLQDGTASVDHFMLVTEPPPLFRPLVFSEALHAAGRTAPSDHLAIVLDLAVVS